MISLRPYQRDAANAFWRGMQAHQRQIIVLPTGTGKTVLALAIAKRLFGDGRILWVAHRDELITQPYETCAAVWPKARRGIVKANRNDCNAQIIFASVQTISRPARAAQLGRFDFVVQDECHHSNATTWQHVAENVGCFEHGGPRLLGLTATPERTDGARLDKIFERIAFVYHLQQAVNDGYLVPVQYQQRKLDLNLDCVRTNKRGDFDETDLDLALVRAGVVDEICKAVIDNRDRKTLAFTVSVAQAKECAEKLQAQGIAAVEINGETPTEIRQARLRRLKSGDLQCVINCMLLTEGFDEPSVDCIVMARPTTSKPLYCQCIGRGLRIAPNKRDCLVIDLVGASKHHNLIQAPVLFGADNDEIDRETRRQYEFDPDIAEWNERKLLLGQVKGLQPIQRSNMRWVNCGKDGAIAISAGRGGTVIARQHGNKWTVIVAKQGSVELLVENADLELAQGIAEDYVRRCEASGWVEKGARWRNEKATQKQIDLLKKFKVKIHGEMSRGEASDFVTHAIATSWKYEPATKKQLSALDARGIEYKSGITKIEARRVLYDG